MPLPKGRGVSISIFSRVFIETTKQEVASSDNNGTANVDIDYLL
ncbi:hypothetical protein phi32_118 [Escherichia phage phiEco32]|uniref:Uncharacterized protein n=1 Tax=Escherichia phage Phieco32 TaxID=2679905 RepID=B0FIT0_BPE32|nr:hypothetical protein phi32_118 [Escherichia phage phiEco32]ABY52919.1 hypothetical protein phi32_118 [Escherichia phage phiEco32]